jgi:hypothetical protein
MSDMVVTAASLTLEVLPLAQGVPGSSRRARLRISSEARQDNRPFVLRAAGLSPKERFSDDVGRSPRCLTSRSV